MIRIPLKTDSRAMGALACGPVVACIAAVVKLWLFT